MTTEEALAKLTAAHSLLDEVRTGLTPPPVIPAPDAPTLSILSVDGPDDQKTISLNAVFPADTVTPYLDYIALDTTGHGPQEWTPIQASGVPNVNVSPTANRVLQIRARAQNDGGTSEPALLTVNLNDYLPPVE